jgi:cytochrome c-type biogenesis protein CcmH
MRAQAEPAPEAASPAGEDPHAGLPEPGARPAAAPADGVRGTVELASGVRPAPGAVVFVSVRPAGTAGGPPLAAKRLAASAFPLAFEVGPGDSMMGQALPDRVRLDVRVDGDGDPMTRDPADPSASADDVRLGAAGVRLVVKKGP